MKRKIFFCAAAEFPEQEESPFVFPPAGRNLTVPEKKNHATTHRRIAPLLTQTKTHRAGIYGGKLAAGVTQGFYAHRSPRTCHSAGWPMPPASPTGSDKRSDGAALVWGEDPQLTGGFIGEGRYSGPTDLRHVWQIEGTITDSSRRLAGVNCQLGKSLVQAFFLYKQLAYDTYDTQKPVI